LRVLVVDDEADTCSNLSDILTDVGYHVDCAYDGRSALELVRRTRYDIALLDLRMPGMDGLTLYREIKRLRADIVAMLVTAYAGGSTTEEAIGAGAWHVLPKPVDLHGLLRLLKEAQGLPLVLLVDDDHELCECLWQILHEQGYRVAVAHDAPGAMEHLRNAAYRVALLDMKLPGCDGSEIYRLVRETNPQARVILITGCRPEMDRVVQRVLDAGADAACYKPFDVPRLLSTLNRLAGIPE
jgi:DNA-binding response OmpR family regulator